MQQQTVFVALLSIAAAVAAQDRRVPPPEGARRLALVVGNDAYSAGVGSLRNAVNDATAMAAALKELGFAVEPAVNLTRAGLERAVEGFAARVQPGDVAVFYYAGHAIQLGEEGNYLVPVDFRAQDEIDARDAGYRAQKVLDKLKQRGARLRVLILDSCRNNPFSERRAVGSGGLAEMRAAEGDYIAFSAAPGKAASDNPAAGNGLFTAQLLRSLKEPGLGLDALFRRVRQGVHESSRGAQLPYTSDGTLGEFFFRPGAGAVAVPPSAGPPPPQPPAGGLDLQDLEKQSQSRQQWAGYRSRMAEDFGQAEQFERSSQGVDLKAAAWERFLQAYATDDPTSGEDDRLRSDARARVEKWKQQAAAPAQAPSVPGPGGGRVNPKDGLEYASIPAGTFQMGCVPQDSACAAAEKPRHPVALTRGFWMGKTEVTVGAFSRFASQAGYRTAAEKEGWAYAWDGAKWDKKSGASWQGPGFAQSDTHPVVDVSWDDAKAFCEWSGGRLPTEAEWEYAARAGSETIYVWGNDTMPVKDGRKQANVADETAKRKYAGFGIFSGYDDGYAETAPVASFAPSGLGLYDLTGNVWEWCSDFYQDSYAGAAGTDPKGASSGQYRVLRGGSWHVIPWFGRVSCRLRYVPGYRNGSFGIRCVRDVAP